MNSTIFNFKSNNPVYFLPATRQICDFVTDLASCAFGAEPVALNLSAINCRTFRRTSKQYQNLIFCKQTQNEREGHSREYPHRPIQIWTCHTQTVEVHMGRLHYAVSREPELLFFHIALPATVFRYQSLQCAGERTSLLLGLYVIDRRATRG